MNDDTYKDNANPVIHLVHNNKKLNKRRMLDPVKRWKEGQFIEDRCIREALGEHATLLEKVGVNLNENGSINNNTESSCLFVPRGAGNNTISDDDNNGDKEMEIERERIDANEIFEYIRNIQDPEHPLTLEQLNVVNLDHVTVEDKTDGISMIDIRFTPTVPHCSMATLIGLCLKVKLLRSLPRRFLVTVRIEPGTHASEHAINKQLSDKERVAAALENNHLLGVVNKCIGNGMKGELSE